ncbi:hypothetical protein [Desulfomonile tiedjei]|uniref:Uncharacterized protein n=1 Tax=Desulfomonile tiedjei (strain ATCC 49306 / DSM 6799 / DCB-1) TaxID=706587 RepID=I4C8Z5_DESTA|nr:hypothetical protein [Desulfomonile tiedjei]AFM26036.1 hypothetical protein Desti_3381 [Desulfomonile tiedjei DSM 6799]
MSGPIMRALSAAAETLKDIQNSVKELKQKGDVAPLRSPELLTLRKDLGLIETRINSMFPESKIPPKQAEPQPPREPAYTTKSEQASYNFQKISGKFDGLFASGSITVDIPSESEPVKKFDAPVGKFTGAW